MMHITERRLVDNSEYSPVERRARSDLVRCDDFEGKGTVGTKHQKKHHL